MNMNSSNLEMDLAETTFLKYFFMNDIINKKNKGKGQDKTNGIKNCKAEAHIGYITFKHF